MAQYPEANSRTRPHWAGTNADRDIHLEVFEGNVQTEFYRGSLFQSRGWSSEVDLEGKSNNYRIEQFGGTKVRSRASGDALTSDRILNDKRNIEIDRAQYSRTRLDYIDDWTSPDRSQQISKAHGVAHAKAYDRFHMKGLMNAARHTVKAELKRYEEFHDGMVVEMTGFDAETDLATKADIFVRAVWGAAEELTYRDLDPYFGEFQLLVKPEIFTLLYDAEKLQNVLYGSDTGGNNFVQRRMATLAGFPIVETPVFPRSTGAIAEGFDEEWEFTQDDVNTMAILFHPGMTLTTIWAQKFKTREWDDENNHNNVLETYAMYIPATQRSDGVVAFLSDAVATP